jgi:AcrR family transcriptional regulator
VVARSQRTRIIHGTAAVVTEKGYADTTVADIVTAAGISRDTFYEYFTNKLDAFLAAQQFATQELLDACASAWRTSLGPLQVLLGQRLGSSPTFRCCAAVAMDPDGELKPPICRRFL